MMGLPLKGIKTAVVVAFFAAALGAVLAQEAGRRPSSYSPVVIQRTSPA
jgi:hypothetical protein